MHALPVIETDRLVLRRPMLEDAEAVRAFCDNPGASWAGFGIPIPYTVDHARRWILKAGDQADAERAYTFLITLRGSGTVIGDTVLERHAEHQRGGLGYILGAESRGCGYATEAGRAMVDFGFRALGLNKIDATCWARNTESARVLEKLGFVREGVLREHAIKWGRYEDDVYYGLLRREWESRERS